MDIGDLGHEGEALGIGANLGGEHGVMHLGYEVFLCLSIEGRKLGP